MRFRLNPNRSQAGSPNPGPPPGGLINYALQNQLYQKDYVVNYTNAAFVVRPDYAFQDGLFAGYQKDKRAYDTQAWDYEADKDGKPVMDLALRLISNQRDTNNPIEACD
jgi:hypothetical protein